MEPLLRQQPGQCRYCLAGLLEESTGVTQELNSGRERCSRKISLVRVGRQGSHSGWLSAAEGTKASLAQCWATLQHSSGVLLPLLPELWCWKE